MKKLIVGLTGSRNGYPWHNRIMESKLDLIASQYDQIELRVGDCPTGFDSYALSWAIENQHKFQQFRAEWQKYGKKAGPIRNQNLVDSFYEIEEDHVFVAFPIRELPCNGTRGCLKMAIESDLCVVEYELGLLEGFSGLDISYVTSHELAKLQLLVARWEKLNNEPK